uniref:Uncharacterized protein n=1 Tax=Cucumis melo TaxID=3656 RepID=A0A9I9EET6_CUCME
MLVSDSVLITRIRCRIASTSTCDTASFAAAAATTTTTVEAKVLEFGDVGALDQFQSEDAIYGTELVTSESVDGDSVLKHLRNHQDAILCCSLKEGQPKPWNQARGNEKGLGELLIDMNICNILEMIW